MKTLIAYATKYGSVRDCADLLKKNLQGEVKILNLKEVTKVNLDDYDNVMIGGSIYFSKIQKEVKKFFTDNEDKLLNKNIGLFVCCGQVHNDRPEFVKMFFNQKISKQAIAVGNFGGSYDYKVMGIVDKIVTAIVSRSTKSKSFIRKNKIKDFTMAFNTK